MNDRAEVNGRKALTDDRHTIAVSDLPADAAPQNSTPDSFAVRGFQKGYDPRRNLAGRIKKAPTVIDELAKQAHQAKHRKRVASAWIATAEAPHTPSGQRAREALADRLYGKVADEFHVTTGELPPGMGWLQRLSGEVVEGESRVLPDTADEGETT